MRPSTPITFTIRTPVSTSDPPADLVTPGSALAWLRNSQTLRAPRTKDSLSLRKSYPSWMSVLKLVLNPYLHFPDCQSQLPNHPCWLCVCQQVDSAVRSTLFLESSLWCHRPSKFFPPWPPQLFQLSEWQLRHSLLIQSFKKKKYIHIYLSLSWNNKSQRHNRILYSSESLFNFKHPWCGNAQDRLVREVLATSAIFHRTLTRCMFTGSTKWHLTCWFHLSHLLALKVPSSIPAFQRSSC